MQSIEFPSDTDGALSPPVRSSYNKSESYPHTGKFSVLESRATHAEPAKRQQTLMDFDQTTKSGSHQHHANSKKPSEALLQKGRAANMIHSGIRLAGETAFNIYRSELQRQIDARKKAAAATQERQRAASRAEQVAARRLDSGEAKCAAAKRRLENNRAEEDAWIDRASVTSRPSTSRDHCAEQDAFLDCVSATAQTSASRPKGHATLPITAADRAKIVAARRRLETHRAEQDAFIDRAAAARNSTSRPPGHTSHPNVRPARPRPAAPTRPFPKSNATKQPSSILGQLGADAKKAKERQARRGQMCATPDDRTDSQTQREAEENHAISKPPPYQPLGRINTTSEVNHAPNKPRPREPLRTTNAAPEPNDDSKAQADPDNELVLEPSPPPQVPFSLNSAAGIRVIQRSIPRPQPINLPFDNDTPAQTAARRIMGTSTPKTKLSLGKPSRNQDLLPITASDLKLYQWRERKINWAEVRQLYSDFTGITPLKSEDALRTRFRQVSKVVEIGVVTDEMCERVINGDEQAAAELNRLAAQYADVSGSTTNPAGPEAAPFRKILQQKTPAPRGVTVPPPLPPAATPAAPRPTQGGKNIDHDTHIALLLNYAAANATESDSDTDSRAGSPPAPEDCIHWEYYMKRRDLYSEDLGSDFEALDSEVQWAEYNASFGHAGNANAEACQWIFAVPEGSPAILRPGEEYTLTHQPREDGMSFWSLQTAYGLVQVEVCRRLWSWQDHVMPETKKGWLPKTLWTVVVKKTQRKTIMVKKKRKVATVAADEDDLFGEGEEREEEYYEEEEGEEEPCVEVKLSDDVYGSLDHANQEAIREWADLTTKPSSANYDEFKCKCAEARQELQRKLEEAGEGTIFRKVVKDGEKTVEVFAKALNMKGARN